MDKIGALEAGMTSLPRDERARVEFRSTKCGIVAVSCAQGVATILLICGIVAAVQLALDATPDSQPDPDVRTGADGFVCQGCGGYCPSAADCSRCTCLMAPSTCDLDDAADSCWELSYERSLRPAGTGRAICGVYTIDSETGCGL